MNTTKYIAVIVQAIQEDIVSIFDIKEDAEKWIWYQMFLLGQDIDQLNDTNHVRELHMINIRTKDLNDGQRYISDEMGLDCDWGALLFESDDLSRGMREVEERKALFEWLDNKRVIA